MPNLYNANIRLAGLLTHDVYKTNMTKNEVIVLRAIHGDDAVVNLAVSKSPDEKVNLTNDQDLARLANIYSGKVVEDTFRVNLRTLDFGLEEAEPNQAPTVDINAVLDAVDAQAAAPVETKAVEPEGEKHDNTQEATTLE